MDLQQLEELKNNGYYISVPQGRSMLPMLRDGRDAVRVDRICEPPRKYDLVLYLRSSGRTVIHRVCGQKNGRYVIIGDNCGYRELVPPDRIYGLVTEFCRHGKWHKVTERGYRLYARVWVFLGFLRRPVLMGYAKLRRGAAKLLRRLREGENHD